MSDPSQRQDPRLLQKQSLSLSQYFKISLLAMSYRESLEQIESELKDNPFLRKSPSLQSPSSSESVSDIIEKTASTEVENLENTLLEQIAFIYKRQSLDFKIAEEIIYSLDSEGFLKDPSNLITIYGKKDFEDVLHQVKNLFPLGCGSSDIRDYFLFCLRQIGIKENESLYKKTSDYLLLSLKLQDPKEVQKSLGFSQKDIDEIVKLLLQFKPYPRHGYNTKKLELIIPDVIIEVKNEELSLKMNDESLRKLEINEEYRESFKEEKNLSSQEKKFLLEKELRAKNLIDAFSYRHEMLKNMMLILMDIQRDFLLGKSPHPKPSTMKNIAKKLSIHPSTITRLISGKYMDSPLGLKPLRILFTKEVHMGKNKEEIIALIRSILEEFDDNKKPLSDRKIAEACKKLGSPIAIRTVAKYRKAYNIASSRGRKQKQ